MESIYDMWCKRNPEWEERYQDSIISVFADYGKGVNQYNEVRSKLLGAGYEVFILAFFIGLYNNKTKQLVQDASKRKSFGWAIANWGNQESRQGRNPYPKLREYMFVALVARADIDWIAVDNGDVHPREAVNKLVDLMERYANFGFDFIQERLELNPNYFFRDQAFLRIFTSFLSTENNIQDDNLEPDELD